MQVDKKRIGIAMTGAFGALRSMLPIMTHLVEHGAEVIPVFSYNVNELDTPYISALELRNAVRRITSRSPITSLIDAEQFARKQRIDALLIAPCTGNSLAKLACGVCDTPALVAAKGQLAMNRPVIIAPYVSDALISNARNIGELLARKQVFFVPFSQEGGPSRSGSITAMHECVIESVEWALEGKQMQPVMRSMPPL
nr:dipicolinate synthase subunit B [Maliibacterium massiliense]